MILSGGCRSGSLRQLIDSKIADITNNAAGGFAGSITAALFLKRFVERRNPGCISTSTPGHRAPSPADPRAPRCKRRGSSSICSKTVTRRARYDQPSGRRPPLTPARPDLAAAHLRGRIEAPRYAEGRSMRVRVEIADLRRTPTFESADRYANSLRRKCHAL